MSIDLPNVSTQTYTYTRKLDTCASTHMTSDIGLFEYFEPNHGVVKVGGDNILLSEGIGVVILNAALSNNSL